MLLRVQFHPHRIQQINHRIQETSLSLLLPAQAALVIPVMMDRLHQRECLLLSESSWTYPVMRSLFILLLLLLLLFILSPIGNVYIADSYNSRIRKVTVSTGIITTIAGTGDYGYSGDNGAATLAKLSYPSGIALDASGRVNRSWLFLCTN